MTKLKIRIFISIRADNPFRPKAPSLWYANPTSLTELAEGNLNPRYLKILII